MTLENLARIGKLRRHSPTPAEITRLIAAVHRNLRDARVAGISAETRFDVAYKAVMQCSLAALMANGFRPSTSEPGHHATLIQSLAITIELPSERCVVLDKLRRLRNLSDYSGADISEEEAAACIRSAQFVVDTLEARLRSKHPGLMKSSE
jgi:hypothetical protein